MNHELLNAVKNEIIAIANRECRCLADEFESQDHFKQFIISTCIKGLTDQGATLPQAYDLVLGEGAYQELADTTFQKLQAKGA